MPRASSKISTIVRSFIQFKLLRWSFRMGGWLAPQTTVNRAAKLFCTPYPGSRRRALEMPVGDARVDAVDSGGMSIARYIWGDPSQQPYVLFAHGWSSHGARILPWVAPHSPPRAATEAKATCWSSPGTCSRPGVATARRRR